MKKRVAKKILKKQDSLKYNKGQLKKAEGVVKHFSKES